MSRGFDTQAIGKAQNYTQPIKTLDGKKITDPIKIRNAYSIGRKGYGNTQGANSMKAMNDAQGQNPNMLKISFSYKEELRKIAEEKQALLIEEVLAAFKKEGGALGMKALYKHVKANKKRIQDTLDYLKSEGKIKQHPHGDLYTPMEKDLVNGLYMIQLVN